MFMAVYLAFKELWRNRGRFFLFSMVIALITVLVLFIAALAEGLGNGNREYIQKLDADLIVYKKSADLFISASKIDRANLANIRRVEGVKQVGPLNFATVSIVYDDGRQPLNVSLIGIEPGQPGEPPVVQGSALKNQRGKQVILDRTAALRTGLKVGDRFTIRAIQGTKEEFYTLEVVGITDGRQYSLLPSLIVPFLTFDEVKPKPVVDNGDSELTSNVVAVQLDNPKDGKAMAARIESQVSDVKAVDLKTAYENTPGYSAQQGTLNSQQFFTLLIGVLVMGGFFQIQTLQKVPQIGMLKAIGTRNRDVAVASILQIMAVTVVGVAMGSVITYGLTLTFPPTVPIVLTGSAAALGIGALLIIGPLGGLVSIRHAVKVEPLMALGLAQ
jgi:putative ABC transport system permease protein